MISIVLAKPPLGFLAKAQDSNLKEESTAEVGSSLISTPNKPKGLAFNIWIDKGGQCVR